MNRAHVTFFAICSSVLLLIPSPSFAQEQCAGNARKINCALNGAIVNVCPEKCPAQQQNNVSAGEKENSVSSNTNKDASAAKAIECDKANLTGLSGGVQTCWKQGIRGGVEEKSCTVPSGATTCQDLQQKAIEAMSGGKNIVQGQPGTPSGVSADSQSLGGKLGDYWDQLFGPNESQMQLNESMNRALNPNLSSYEQALIDQNINFNNAVQAGTVRPPINTTGSLGDVANYQKLIDQGRINPSQLYEYLQGSGRNTFDLSELPTANNSGTFSPSPYQQYVDSVSAANGGSSFYQGLGDLVRPTGTFSNTGSPDPFALPTSRPSTVSTLADGLNGMWQTAKATAAEAWAGLKTLATGSVDPTLNTTEFTESPFGEAEIVDVNSGELVTSKAILDSMGSRPEESNLDSLASIEDVIKQFEGVTPEQFQKGVAEYVLEKQARGELISSGEALALKAAVEEQPDNRAWFTKLGDSLGLQLSDRAQAIAALDGVEREASRQESLRYLAQNAGGPSGVQDPLNQINPTIAANEQAGLKNSPSGPSDDAFRKQGLPGYSTGVSEGSRVGIDTFAGEKGTQTGETDKTFLRIERDRIEAAQDVVQAERRLQDVLKNSENTQLNLSQNGSISGGRSEEEVLRMRAAREAVVRDAAQAEARSQAAIQEKNTAIAAQNAAEESLCAQTNGCVMAERTFKTTVETNTVGAMTSKTEDVIARVRTYPEQEARIARMDAIRTELSALDAKAEANGKKLSQADFQRYQSLANEHNGLREAFNTDNDRLTKTFSSVDAKRGALFQERSVAIAEANASARVQQEALANFSSVAAPLDTLQKERFEAVNNLEAARARFAEVNREYQERISDPVQSVLDERYRAQSALDKANLRALQLRSEIDALNDVAISPRDTGLLYDRRQEIASLGAQLSDVEGDINTSRNTLGFLTNDPRASDYVAFMKRDPATMTREELAMREILPQLIQQKQDALQSNLSFSEMIDAYQRGDMSLGRVMLESALTPFTLEGIAGTEGPGWYDPQGNLTLTNARIDQILQGKVTDASLQQRINTITGTEAPPQWLQERSDYWGEVVQNAWREGNYPKLFGGGVMKSLWDGASNVSSIFGVTPVTDVQIAGLARSPRSALGAFIVDSTQYVGPLGIVTFKQAGAIGRGLGNFALDVARDDYAIASGVFRPPTAGLSTDAAVLADRMGRSVTSGLNHEITAGRWSGTASEFETVAAQRFADRVYHPELDLRPDAQEVRAALSGIRPDAPLPPSRALVLYEPPITPVSDAIPAAIPSRGRAVEVPSVSGINNVESIPLRNIQPPPVMRASNAPSNVPSGGSGIDSLVGGAGVDRLIPSAPTVLSRIGETPVGRVLKQAAVIVGLAATPNPAALPPFSLFMPEGSSIGLAQAGDSVSASVVTGEKSPVTLSFGRDGSDTSRVSFLGNQTQWRNVDVRSRHVAAAKELNNLGGMKWEGVREVQKIKPELFNDVPIVNGKPDLTKVVPEKINIISCNAPYACFASHADAAAMVSAKLDYQPAYVNAKTYNDVVKLWVGTDVINGSFDDLSRLRHAETGGLTLTTPIARNDLAARAALTKGIFKAEYPALARYGIEDPITNEALRDGLAKVFGSEPAAQWYAQTSRPTAIAEVPNANQGAVNTPPEVANPVVRSGDGEVPPSNPTSEPTNTTAPVPASNDAVATAVCTDAKMCSTGATINPSSLPILPDATMQTLKVRTARKGEVDVSVAVKKIPFNGETYTVRLWYMNDVWANRENVGRVRTPAQRDLLVFHETRANTYDMFKILESNANNGRGSGVYVSAYLGRTQTNIAGEKVVDIGILTPFDEYYAHARQFGHRGIGVETVMQKGDLPDGGQVLGSLIMADAARAWNPNIRIVNHQTGEADVLAGFANFREASLGAPAGGLPARASEDLAKIQLAQREREAAKMIIGARTLDPITPNPDVATSLAYNRSIASALKQAGFEDTKAYKRYQSALAKNIAGRPDLGTEPTIAEMTAADVVIQADIDAVAKLPRTQIAQVPESAVSPDAPRIAQDLDGGRSPFILRPDQSVVSEIPIGDRGLGGLMKAALGREAAVEAQIAQVYSDVPSPLDVRATPIVNQDNPIIAATRPISPDFSRTETYVAQISTEPKLINEPTPAARPVVADAPQALDGPTVVANVPQSGDTPAMNSVGNETSGAGIQNAILYGVTEGVIAAGNRIEGLMNNVRNFVRGNQPPSPEATREVANQNVSVEANRRAIEIANRQYQEGIGRSRIQGDPNEIARRAEEQATKVLRENLVADLRRESLPLGETEILRKQLAAMDEVWRAGIGSSPDQATVLADLSEIAARARRAAEESLPPPSPTSMLVSETNPPIAPNPRKELVAAAEADLAKAQVAIPPSIRRLKVMQEELLRARQIGGLDGLEILKNTSPSLRSGVGRLADAAENVAKNPLVPSDVREGLLEQAKIARTNVSSLAQEVDNFYARNIFSKAANQAQFKARIASQGAKVENAVIEINTLLAKVSTIPEVRTVSAVDIPTVQSLSHGEVVTALAIFDTISAPTVIANSSFDVVVRAVDVEDIPTPSVITVADNTPAVAEAPAVPVPTTPRSPGTPAPTLPESPSFVALVRDTPRPPSAAPVVAADIAPPPNTQVTTPPSIPPSPFTFRPGQKEKEIKGSLGEAGAFVPDRADALVPVSEGFSLTSLRSSIGDAAQSLRGWFTRDVLPTGALARDALPDVPATTPSPLPNANLPRAPIVDAVPPPLPQTPPPIPRDTTPTPPPIPDTPPAAVVPEAVAPVSRDVAPINDDFIKRLDEWSRAQAAREAQIAEIKFLRDVAIEKAVITKGTSASGLYDNAARKLDDVDGALANGAKLDDPQVLALARGALDDYARGATAEAQARGSGAGVNTASPQNTPSNQTSVARRAWDMCTGFRSCLSAVSMLLGGAGVYAIMPGGEEPLETPATSEAPSTPDTTIQNQNSGVLTSTPPGDAPPSESQSGEPQGVAPATPGESGEEEKAQQDATGGDGGGVGSVADGGANGDRGGQGGAPGANADSGSSGKTNGRAPGDSTPEDSASGDVPGSPPSSGSGSGGFSRGGMSVLQGLLQGLFAFFDFGGGGEEEPPRPPTEPQSTPQPVVIVGAIVANPSFITSGSTTTLSWSSVGTDVGSSTCAVISADFKVFHRGPQNGSISSPTITESTRFGLVCNTKNTTDKLLHETLVRVRGDDSDPERIFTPEEIARSQSTPVGTGGSGSGSGNGGGGGSSGQSGNPTPEDVRTCEPEQPINSFIQCLCEAEPNPAGCAVPPGGLR